MEQKIRSPKSSSPVPRQEAGTGEERSALTADSDQASVPSPDESPNRQVPGSQAGKAGAKALPKRSAPGGQQRATSEPSSASPDTNEPPAETTAIAGDPQEDSRRDARASKSPVPSAGRFKAKAINLALQGGGAHGAFAWGVLDRLLENQDIEFEGISATSAGSMNAVVTACGLAQGGRERARELLKEFWYRISLSSIFSPLQPGPWDRMSGNHSLDSSPAYLFFDLVTRLLSPYQINPLNFNPLAQILIDTVDFELLRQRKPVKLFLCATNVRTGKVKIFDNSEITADAVLASGCLPFLFHTVTVEGEPYWDGGYMGNPAIFPLIYSCDSRDIAIVHINPIIRDEIPTTASAILNRLNEVSFNSSLMREMRAIAFVTRLIDSGKVGGGMKKMLIHSIENEGYMSSLSVSTKLNPDWGFLCELCRVGRECADRWLADNFGRIGKESTINIQEKFL